MRWQEWFRRYVPSGNEVATEAGKQGVLKALATCVRDWDVATARVGSGKEEAEKEGGRAPISVFFFVPRILLQTRYRSVKSRHSPGILFDHMVADWVRLARLRQPRGWTG